MKKLSVVLATLNEEDNLRQCLAAVKGIADEIVVVDGSSTDNTVKIAKKFDAKVLVKDNPPNFHINKQKALDLASGDWILQLDADEIVSSALAAEIKKLINMSDEKIEQYEHTIRQNLFTRHTEAVERRDGKIGSPTGSYTAFFVPRKNYFLGRFLTHGGVYPDGVIRLVKNGHARFACKSVHEQITITGRVGWLQHDLEHYADKTFGHYVTRFNRYTDLEAQSVTGGSFANLIWKPLFDPMQGFLVIYFRHLGFLDGFPGFIWALFSALHFPIAYFKSIEKNLK